MLFIRLLARLPFALLYLMARVSYFLCYYVIGYRRAVVVRNLRRAFPDKSRDDIQAISKAFYRHLTNLAFEVIKARRMSAKEFQQRCQLLGTEKLLEQTRNGQRSIIVLTIHQGNWEWMLHSTSLQLNMQIDPVYKPLHHQGWNQFIHEIRSRFSSRPLAMSESSRDILRHRRECRLLVMLADQTPIDGEPSYWTTYLNQDAPFHPGVERIAQLTKFPVFFAQCRRLKTGYYQLEFKPLGEPPYDKNTHALLDDYVAQAEVAIREQPETFIWSHRRWKRSRPPEEKNSTA